LTQKSQAMSTPTETSPLLENGGYSQDTSNNLSLPSRAASFFKGEGEPSWPESYKFFIFGTWFNILLVFIPLSFVSHYLNWDAGLRFLFSFMAIVPLAKVSTSFLPYQITERVLSLYIVAGRSNRPDVLQTRGNHVWSP